MQSKHKLKWYTYSSEGIVAYIKEPYHELDNDLESSIVITIESYPNEGYQVEASYRGKYPQGSLNVSLKDCLAEGSRLYEKSKDVYDKEYASLTLRVREDNRSRIRLRSEFGLVT